MNIIAFAGSNSSTSINKQLVTYASSHFNQDQVTVLDLNDFDLPMYSIDLENASGIPEAAQRFSDHIKNADLLLISLAEHNGAYSAVFKNLFDWLSRIDGTSGFHKKKIFLMATSPGARGGASVLEMAVSRFPRNDGEVIGTFSLPSFNDNFNPEKGITNTEMNNKLIDQLKSISIN